jgi:hypothetical protein
MKLAIFLSEALNFVLHFHIVSCGELAPQGAHLFSD